MKLLYSVVIIICFLAPLKGQYHMREAGIRGGLTSGFTYRHYLGEKISYEGILSFRKAGTQFTLIRQVHELSSPLNLGPELNFLYGFGGHAGYYYSDKFNSFGFTEFHYPQARFSPVAGVDAYAAIEYRAHSFPVVIGLDYKPFFEYSLYHFFKLRLWDLAFNVRYRF